MDSIDYSSIIHSPSFTFLVGPRHTKLTIQSGLAQHVSKPLHNLMNNGHTRESRHRIAVLEEEDVETFVAFCEYAYTGDYKVPRLPVPREYRVSVAESVHSPANSWRGTFRSGSVSSVPPPAPSPPPEFVDDGSKAVEVEPQPEPESTPVIGEEPDAEAAAETTAEVEAEMQTEGQQAETQQEASTEATAEETTEIKTGGVEEEKLAPEDNDSAEKDAQSDQPQDAGSSIPTEETEASNSNDDWATWPAEPKENNEAKGKKGKKKDKKKKKNLAVEEDVPANLTPPTTPPTNPVDLHELTPDNAPEESAEPVEPVEPVEAEEFAEKIPEIASSEIPAEDKPAETHSAEEIPAETNAEHASSEDANVQSEPSHHSNPMPESTPPREEEWESSNNEQQRSWPGPELEPGPESEDQQILEDQQKPIDPPKPVIDMSFAKQPDSSPRTPGMSLWDEFTTLQYTDEHQQKHQPKLNDTPTDLPYLTFHAKVYVFATRYLIPALAQLCLRKLHHDLMNLTLADPETSSGPIDSYEDPTISSLGLGLGGLAAQQVPRILDLVRYAYTKTTRLEPISPTSATQLRDNELRRLVVHYVACKVKILAKYHSPGDSEVATPSIRPIDGKIGGRRDDEPRSLRFLLDMTPELASDLVYRMM
ncbi:hypothetical protein PENSTE_c034G05571 [Penicillium steckii]|uniref:BTB domain-containing protein n=1 Tax=Penicillium steckii TaxID=303698 RepID=A0A1V6SLS6_9EURO|nr:hypothetical protein PENSTE_c034G05571 [Penicillium steckii]